MLAKEIMNREEIKNAIDIYKTAIRFEDYETALSMNNKLYANAFARYKMWREIKMKAGQDNCGTLLTIIDSAIGKATGELDFLFRTGLDLSNKIHNTTTKEEAK